jgi:hypothetical protein
MLSIMFPPCDLRLGRFDVFFMVIGLNAWDPFLVMPKPRHSSSNTVVRSTFRYGLASACLIFAIRVGGDIRPRATRDWCRRAAEVMKLSKH